MKKKLLIFLFGMFSLLFVSCDSDKQGPSGDEIELSQKETTFTAEQNTITITTKRKGWWVSEFMMDKVSIPKGDVNFIAENFLFKNDDFQLEKKNGNTLIITMNKNTTNKERLLRIGLQAGNYFSSINITQAK